MLTRTALVLSVLSGSSVLGFDFVDMSPEHMMVPEGEETDLFCATDEPYDLCTWTLPSGDKCMAVADQMGDVACKHDSSISFDLSEHSCGIHISEVSPDHTGEFRCDIIVNSASDDPVDKIHTMFNVTVAVQAKVSFSVDSDDVRPVRAEEAFVVECHARGGNPVPEVRAMLGEEEDVIDEDNDLMMEHMERGREETLNDDGTTDVKEYFAYVPHIADCGKFVKCEAIQRDPEGNTIFTSGSSVVSQKIMVQFPPQPSETFRGEVPFTPGDEMVEAVIEFQSSPEPTDQQAIWTITPFDSPAMEVTLEAGQTSDGGKYEAMPLNTSSGHNVKAVLRVYNLIDQDKEYQFSLSVENAIGEETYEFQLTNYAQLVTDEPSGDGEPPKHKEGGISGGTIAAIVIVIIIVVIGLGVVFWARRNNKWCFTNGTGSKSKTSPQQKQQPPPANDSSRDVEANNASVAANAKEDQPLNTKDEPNESSKSNRKSSDPGSD